VPPGKTDASGNTDLAKTLASKKVGEKLSVLISRDGLIQQLDVTLTQNESARYRIEIDKNASSEQILIRNKWLSL
jgi:predicted metalloprotease with PDZ domain